MKKLLLLLCLPLMTLAQQTYVPDNNFEQELINLGYDNILDDYVITTNISYLTVLYVNNKNISDMTGIEDFTALNNLNCSYNQMTTINLNDNTALEYLTANNNNLTTIDISQNNALSFINIKSNQLVELNLQNGFNNNITTFLATDNPNLYCIDVDDPVYSTANWTNIDAWASFSTNCSGGTGCTFTQTDESFPGACDGSISITNVSGCIPPYVYVWNNGQTTPTISGLCAGTYSFAIIDSNGDTCCSNITIILTTIPSGILNITNTEKTLLKVTDLLGKEAKQTNQPLFYIYDDGTVEKRIVIE